MLLQVAVRDIGQLTYIGPVGPVVRFGVATPGRSRVRADGYRADGQRGGGLHDRGHQGGLVVEFASLGLGQLAERLDGEG
jgi:hypothetical protein